VIWGITESFEVIIVVSSLKSLHHTSFVFKCVCVCETVMELELTWTKLKGLRTDGSKYD
jgi:hypothetical protein